MRNQRPPRPSAGSPTLHRSGQAKYPTAAPRSRRSRGGDGQAPSAAAKCQGRLYGQRRPDGYGARINLVDQAAHRRWGYRHKSRRVGHVRHITRPSSPRNALLRSKQKRVVARAKEAASPRRLHGRSSGYPHSAALQRYKPFTAVFRCALTHGARAHNYA